MNVERIIKGVISIAIIGLVLGLVWYFWQIVLYIILAAILSLVGRPLVVKLLRIRLFNHSMSRTLAAAITLVVMWVVVGLLCALFIPLLFGKVHELAAMDWDGVTAVIESSISNLRVMLQRTFSLEFNDVGDAFKNFMLNLVDVDYVKTFSSVASVIKSAAIAFFSVSFITFYFMKEDGLFYRLVAIFFPDKYHTNVFNALDSITTLLSRYFGGLMVESLLLIVVISVAMLIFGMKSSDALIVGLLIGVFNLIPYAGPVIGSFLSLCIAIISPIEGDVLHTVLILCSTIAVVKLIDDFIIQPTIYSDRVQAHPLEIFLCISIAGYVAGVWGMLLAIPLYTILRVFAREFFSEYSLVRKLTSQMTK